jgi:hypothetical protein
MGCSIVERASGHFFSDQAINKGYTDPRFKLVPTFILGKPYWKTEKNWNPKNHIRIVTDLIPDKNALRKFSETYYG